MNVRLAVVGCGAIAEDMHIPTAQETTGVDLVALVDSDLDRAEHLRTRFGIPRAVSDLRELAGEVDAVILATPPHVRVKLAEQAFSQAFHVLCEKPLANTVEECEAITRASQETDCVLAVGHMFRFWPVRMEIKRIVEEKRYGRVISVTATEGKPYAWQTVTGYTVRREMVPGGVMINAGIHTLDALLWWLGDPQRIDYKDDAVGGLESNVKLEMSFGDGVAVSFRQSRTCMLPYRIKIEFEDAVLNLATNSIFEYDVRMKGQTEQKECEGARVHAECWRAQLEDFVHCALNGGCPKVTGEEGTRVIRLIEDCYKQKRARPLPERAPLPGYLW